MFHKKLCDQTSQKSDPIDYNGEQNLMVCHTRPDLVYLLQGVNVVTCLVSGRFKEWRPQAGP